MRKYSTQVRNHLVVVLYSRGEQFLLKKALKHEEQIYEFESFPLISDPQEAVMQQCKNMGYTAKDIKPFFDFYHGDDRYLCYKAQNQIQVEFLPQYLERNLLRSKKEMMEGIRYRDAVTLTVLQKMILDQHNDLMEEDFQNRKVKLVAFSLLLGMVLGLGTIYGMKSLE